MAALPVGSTPYSPSYSPSTSSTSSPAKGAGALRTGPLGREISLANNPAAHYEAVQLISAKSLDEETQKLRAELRSLYGKVKLAPEAQRLLERINNRGGKLTDTIVSDLTATTAIRLKQDVAITVSEDKTRERACTLSTQCQGLFNELLKNDPENVEKSKKELKEILGEIQELLDTNVKLGSIGVDLHEILYDGKLFLKDKQDKIPQKNGIYCSAYDRTAKEILENCQNRYGAILAAWTNREVTAYFDDELEDLEHLLEFLRMLQNSSYCMKHKLMSELPALMKLYEDIKDFIDEMKPIVKSVNNGTPSPLLCTFNISISPTETVTWKMFKSQNFLTISRGIQKRFGEGTFFLSNGKRLLEIYPGFPKLSPDKQAELLDYIYRLEKLSISYILDNSNDVRRNGSIVNESRIVVASYRDHLRTFSATHVAATSHLAPPSTSTAIYRSSPATPPPGYSGHPSAPPAYNSSAVPSVAATATAYDRPPSAPLPPSYPEYMSAPPTYSIAMPSVAATATAYYAPPSATLPPAHTGNLSSRTLSSHTWTPIHQSGSIALSSTSSFRSKPVPPTTKPVPPAATSVRTSSGVTEDVTHLFTNGN